VQRDLQAFNIAGQDEYRINPAKDDFFRRLIDMRRAIKSKIRNADATEKSRLEIEQQALKIIANSTGYGLNMELNSEELPRRISATCFGVDGSEKTVSIDKVETPGSYFYPLLGTLITGAARLMLAIGERLVQDAGLDWVLCDTDSLAIAKPGTVNNEEFWSRISGIREWFTPLNPYQVKESLLKLEDISSTVNEAGNLVPLYAFAISAKRYVLFNLDEHGRPIIRKASAHGLGHLLRLNAALNADDGDEDEIYKTVEKISVEPWQRDYWLRVIQAALDGHPGQVNIKDLPGFDMPAVSKYAATSPRLLSWFKNYNQGKPYRKQVRPFNFILTFQADPGALNPDGMPQTSVYLPKAVAPYDIDRVKAAKRCFDRETGKSVPARALKPYSKALLRYHLRPEAKFRGGNAFDTGKTERRHLRVTSINLIGKEANRWQLQFYLGLDPEAQNEYGVATADQKRMLGTVQKAVDVMGIGKFALATNWSRRHLSDIMAERKSLRDGDLAQLAKAATKLSAGILSPQEALMRLSERCELNGVRATASELGVNDGYLSRVLTGKRRVTGKLLSLVLDNN
jgi:DNA polymerase family B